MAGMCWSISIKTLDPVLSNVAHTSHGHKTDPVGPLFQMQSMV